MITAHAQNPFLSLESSDVFARHLASWGWWTLDSWTLGALGTSW